jgi:uncharacterized membrane protein YcaP (DUF421 family)
MDWDSIFVPTLPLAEIVLRGTMVYLGLFFMLRVLRREAGDIGISDLLVVVLIADASQNAMASEYQSITEGLILVATIAFWDYFLDWLGYRLAAVERLLRPAPLLLIKNGRMLKQNMKRELIREEELMGQLREQGISELQDVKRCYLEGDGHVSVIKRSSMR